ncbi:MAG: hypothetical protein RLZ53_952 [Actinomycetota bacterium]|jgi:uncharacterized membrane protein YvbJ
MFCTNCGSQIVAGGFCANCGTQAAPAPAPANQSSPPAAPYTAPSGAPYGVVPKTNGLAIASLVTSLVCFGFIGLILGIVAKNQIKNSKGTQTGDGLATAGIIIGAISTLASFWLLTSADFWNGFNSSYYGY